MSIIKSIKQVLGLGPAAENHHWDGSVPNQLSLKRGTPEAPGSLVASVINGILRLTGGTTEPTAGQIGELLTSSGGPVNIGIALAVGNMASITLTPGVWDVQVFGSFNPSAAGTSIIHMTGSLTAGALGNVSTALLGAAIGSGVSTTLTGNVGRLVVAANTAVYCTARASGTSGTINCTGTITARRVA